jgi:hypothetical protein
MEDNESGKFAWSVLFVVTAISSFLFNIAIKYLEGHFSGLLFRIGGIAVLLLILNRLGRIISRPKRKDCSLDY